MNKLVPQKQLMEDKIKSNTKLVINEFMKVKNLVERYKNYKFCVTKSPHDSRDWVAESIFPVKTDLNIPATLDLRPDMLAVRDQGQHPTCASFAASAMKEWQEDIDVKLDRMMSPQFVYSNRSNYPSDGMYLRDVCQILQSLGDCREATLPYLSVDKKEDIPKTATDDALRYKIQSYAQVTTVDGLKTALYKSGPCLVAFPVYNYGATFWKQNGSETQLGGHAVSIVGYTDVGFIIRNSWGSEWNDNGYTIYPFEQFGMHWEIWTTIDDKSPSPDPSPPDPEPEDKGCCKCF